VRVSFAQTVSNWGENMPKWNPQNLQKHFDKHVSRSAACAQDVFGHTASSVTEDDYKDESMKVLSTAWICYSGEKSDKQHSSRAAGIVYFDPANHFVDDRLLTTIVSRNTDTILTCYHEHFDRPHKPSMHKCEEMVKYLERLRYQRQGDELKNFSVERFAPPAAAFESLQAELDRVKAIPEKRVSPT
jgi:hypothetical protein